MTTPPPLHYTERHPQLDAVREALTALRQTLAEFEIVYANAIGVAPNAAFRLQVQLSAFYSLGTAPRRLDRELTAAVRALHVWQSDASPFGLPPDPAQPRRRGSDADPGAIPPRHLPNRPRRGRPPSHGSR